MPPIPFEYHGREAVAGFCGTILTRRSHDLVPTRANGQPAFGVYLRIPGDGIRHGSGLFVLTLSGDRISAMTRFESSVLPWFGLPASLPANDSDQGSA
jgi:RNA polymerase sigma-70 factor (ECF subfamily)